MEYEIHEPNWVWSTARHINGSWFAGCILRLVPSSMRLSVSDGLLLFKDLLPKQRTTSADLQWFWFPSQLMFSRYNKGYLLPQQRWTLNPEEGPANPTLNQMRCKSIEICYYSTILCYQNLEAFHCISYTTFQSLYIRRHPRQSLYCLLRTHFSMKRYRGESLKVIPEVVYTTLVTYL